MSAEFPAGVHESVTEKRAEQVLADRKAKSWMEKVYKFSRSPKGVFVGSFLIGVGIVKGVESVGHHGSLARLVDRVGLERSPERFEVDQRFEEVGFSPHVVHTGLQEAFL